MLQTARGKRPLVLSMVAAVGLLVLFGCSEDTMGPDTVPPSGTVITNPSDGEYLNSQVINVRGRAEVGARIEVFVNGTSSGSGVSWPAVEGGSYGRFTVENVALGDEGSKTIDAEATDLFGNTSPEKITISVVVDTTSPSLRLRTILGAEWKEDSQYWETKAPQVRLVGWTDTTAAGAKVQFGPTEFTPDSVHVIPAAPGLPDTLMFWVPMTSPPFTGATPDSLADYVLSAYDAAGNARLYPLKIYWNVTGRDTVMRWDDGDMGAFDNWTDSGPLAVKFQAPVWANYITELHYYIVNDGQPGSPNPNDPTTDAFLAWVWRVEQDLPGDPGNSGMNSGSYYPEDEWLELELPNPVNITNHLHYPDKTFFVGMSWESKQNPRVGYDDSDPDYMSFRLSDSGSWVIVNRDFMIRAVVSDIPFSDGGARRAVIAPIR
jgi:hypothetical protein